MHDDQWLFQGFKYGYNVDIMGKNIIWMNKIFLGKKTALHFLYDLLLYKCNN